MWEIIKDFIVIIAAMWSATYGFGLIVHYIDYRVAVKNGFQQSFRYYIKTRK